MRIQIGRIVNTDADVNLLDLSPLDRVIAAGLNAYHNTGLYKRRYAESEERKAEQKRKVREALVDNLLSVIYQQLEENALLRDKEDVCSGILIEIPPRFSKLLPEVIDAHEFDAYDMVIVPPSKLFAKFASPPYMLFVSNKGGSL